jgi:hypothetical protein
MNVDHIDEYVTALTRPLLTIVLISGLTWGFANRLIPGEVYSTIVASAAGYWFGKQGDRPPAVQEHQHVPPKPGTTAGRGGRGNP